MHIFKMKCGTLLYLSIRGVQGVNMINVMLMAGHALKVCWLAEGGTTAPAGPEQHRNKGNHHSGQEQFTLT